MYVSISTHCYVDKGQCGSEIMTYIALNKTKVHQRGLRRAPNVIIGVGLKTGEGEMCLFLLLLLLLLMLMLM
jgi:hypothetical protein